MTGPVKAFDVTGTTCKLSWLPPGDSGGSKITNYVVEKRETSRLLWTSVRGQVQLICKDSASCLRQVPASGLFCFQCIWSNRPRLKWQTVWQVGDTGMQCNITCSKLIPGNQYIFRVSAQNKYGVGPPLESEPVLCKNPYGQSMIGGMT